MTDADRAAEPPEPGGPPPVPRIAVTPRPQDPGPRAQSPELRPRTLARLEQADRDREAALAAAERGAHVRTTVGLGLAAVALAAAWRLFGGRGE